MTQPMTPSSPNRFRIKARVETALVVKKSKFVGYLYPIASEAEAKMIIQSTRKEHPDASHVCSALICADIVRSNDDGEPAGSAGQPMMSVLQGAQLDHVLAIVVRYFGGTLLGVGGLIQTYTSTVQAVLKQATLMTPVIFHTFELNFAYELINPIENALATLGRILDRHYEETVIYTVESRHETLPSTLQELAHGQIEIDPIETHTHFEEAI